MASNAKADHSEPRLSHAGDGLRVEIHFNTRQRPDVDEPVRRMTPAAFSALMWYLTPSLVRPTRSATWRCVNRGSAFNRARMRSFADAGVVTGVVGVVAGVVGVVAGVVGVVAG